MLAKPILFAIIAACGVPSNTNTATSPSAVSHPDDKTPPPAPPQEDQHFCCQSVNLDKQSGEGCVSLSVTHIDTCSEVLYCGGNWGKSNGITKCLD